MPTIDELIARKHTELNSKISIHNDLVEELNELRGQDAPDETKVESVRTRKAAAAADVEKLRGVIAELENDKREVDEFLADSKTTVRTTTENTEVRVTSEPNPVYRKDDTEVSYFRDLVAVRAGGREGQSASERLVRAQTTVAGAGGEFAPPLWLVDEFVALARAGRVTADQVVGHDLPEGVSSINIPKVSGGGATAVVQTQNTTITEQSMTTTSVSSGITEISGKQTVSIALMRQSGIPIDNIIVADLAAAYAVNLDTQVINGANASGELRGLITAGTTITYTTTVPSVVSVTAANSFYSKILGAKSAVESGRKLPADKIIMTPTRWNWVLSALDTGNRPLVVPNGPAFNQAAVTGAPAAEGFAGTLLGLPVYTDPNIPANLGAATNQDVVFVLRSSDIHLWESDVEATSFDATLADQNSILFRVLGFAAFIPHRHQASVQVISGTGLVAPTF